MLYRVFSYSAMIPDRYLASLGQVTGTGLVTPTFANWPQPTLDAWRSGVNPAPWWPCVHHGASGRSARCDW